jgi:transcriptional regulator with PAS, ATPase and Fis domain
MPFTTPAAGAAKRGGKKGKFELANNGTIFLDEIGDMPLSMQAKLLRVIAERSLERVGGTETQAVDIRIIAATNKPLLKMIQEQTFREDLYYRLNVISLSVPPLRELKEDIGDLIERLTHKICKKNGLPAKRFAPETIELFREYHWPGNVRELANLLAQLMAVASGPLITPRHLPQLNWLKPPASDSGTVSGNSKPSAAAGQTERERIAEALSLTKDNKALAAKLLGIHRSTLYEKLKKYNMLK